MYHKANIVVNDVQLLQLYVMYSDDQTIKRMTNGGYMCT